MKQCCDCKTEKPLSEFRRWSSSSDGRSVRCCVCARSRLSEKMIKTGDQIRAYNAAWRLQNAESISDRAAIWYLINRSRVLARGQNPANKKKRIESAPYAANLLRKSGIYSPPRELVELKQAHLLITRELRK